MSKKTIPLTELVALFRQMQSRQWRDGRLHGEIVVANDEMAAFLSDLLSEENADDYPCVVERGDPEALKTGDNLSLGFGSPKTSVGLVVESAEKLLGNREIAAGTADYGWYVFESDVASWEADTELCKRIQSVKRLVEALETSAALFDHRKMNLIFIKNGRFDIPIRYPYSTLQAMDLPIADALTSELELEDGHSKQRKEICCTAICELLAGVPAEIRFSELLLRLSDFRTRFDEGYKLFASSFSFDKIREEAENVKIEYMAKIHKTLSDIQGQLLGIPISTIVVATQFKEASTAPGQFWINVAVITGATIFCALLFIALWNQRHSLDVIAEEVNRHESGLKRQNEELALKLSSVFEKLRGRVKWHKAALWTVFVVAVAAWIVGVLVFWMLSRSAFDQPKSRVDYRTVAIQSVRA